MYLEEFKQNGRKSYYENGNIKVVEVWNGDCESYHENGLIHLKYSNKDGKTNGLYENYDKEGNLYERKNYINGELDGICEIFEPQGVLSYRGFYKKGEDQTRKFEKHLNRIKFVDTLKNLIGIKKRTPEQLVKDQINKASVEMEMDR